MEYGYRLFWCATHFNHAIETPVPSYIGHALYVPGHMMCENLPASAGLMVTGKTQKAILSLSLPVNYGMEDLLRAYRVGVPGQRWIPVLVGTGVLPPSLRKPGITKPLHIVASCTSGNRYPEDWTYLGANSAEVSLLKPNPKRIRQEAQAIAHDFSEEFPGERDHFRTLWNNFCYTSVIGMTHLERVQEFNNLPPLGEYVARKLLIWGNSQLSGKVRTIWHDIDTKYYPRDTAAFSRPVLK